MTKLKNWSFIISGGPYTPPELWKQRLSGEVYDHPNSDRFYDGKEMNTSEILEIDLVNAEVKCKSRTYCLEGPPDPNWLQWIKDNNLMDKYEGLEWYDND